MATILQGPAAKGNQAVCYPGSAGDVVYNRFTCSVPAVTASGVIIEIGSIPPNCRVVDMVLDTDNLGAGAVAQVGVMTGTPGSTDAARTCGAEFFAAGTALSAAAATRMSQQSGFRVTPTPAERSIGVQLGAATVTLGTVAVGVWLAAA